MLTESQIGNYSEFVAEELKISSSGYLNGNGSGDGSGSSTIGSGAMSGTKITLPPPRPFPMLTSLAPTLAKFGSADIRPTRLLTQMTPQVVFSPSIPAPTTAIKATPHRLTTNSSVDKDGLKTTAASFKSIGSLQSKIDADFSQQQQHKLAEQHMKSEIDNIKEEYLEQYQQTIAQQEAYYQQELALKDARIKDLTLEKSNILKEQKQKLKEKDDWYIAQLQSAEATYQSRLAKQEEAMKEKLQLIQDQVNTENERRSLLEKARIEAKEMSLHEAYEKKMKKFAKQIEKIMEHYRDKELVIHGNLEEARREISYLTASHEATMQAHREELGLKDKRLVDMQRELAELDEIERQLDNWRNAARDLSALVIHTCATVEELPAELWQGSAPGLFSSVWDEIRTSKMHGYGKTTIDGSADSYAKKKKECVMANRALLSQCLRYSKVIDVIIQTRKLQF